MGVERKDWADTAVLLRDLRKYFYWKQIFSIKNKTFFSKTNYPLQNRIYFFVILIFHFWSVLKDRILFWNKVVFFEKKNLFYHFETKYFLSKTKLTFQIPKENYFISIARIFKGRGGSIFDWKGQSRERAKRALLTLVGSAVKPRKTFHFLGFESPRLRENWDPECFFSLWIFPIHWHHLWRLLWRLLRRHFCGD